MWLNQYSYEIGMGGSYGHNMKPISLSELLKFDGAVVQDGVQGGNDGATYQQWLKGCADYDEKLFANMNHSHWLQIKQLYKLCSNLLAPKRLSQITILPTNLIIFMRLLFIV